MTSEEFKDKLSIIITELNEKIVNLVHRAQEEDGLGIQTDEPVSFANDFEWQDETDRIITIGGWVYERLKGRNRLHRKSLTKKLRKVLGYSSYQEN